MTERPRKGRPVAFHPEAGAAPPATTDPVTGLRFMIGTQDGREALVDYAHLKPRWLALAFARALRRLAGPGGPLTVRSTVMAYVCTLPKFFAYLADTKDRLAASEHLDSRHIDGFEAWLEANGKSRTNLFIQLIKVVAVLREVAAEGAVQLSASLRDRLAYTSARPMPRSCPRDAYSPYIARQLRDAARQDITRVIQRLRAPETVEHASDLDIVAAAHAAIRSKGILHNKAPEYRALSLACRGRKQSTKNLNNRLHEQYYLTSQDVVPFLVFLALETGLEIECCKTLTIDCLQNPANGTVEIAYFKRRAHGAEHKRLRVRDGGAGTPGGLIRHVIAMTEAARPVIVMQLLSVVFDLYAFRQHLRTAALWFEPWPGRTLSQVAGYRFIVEENRTPRIPENIITPLLAWSLKYVTVFAPDILAARSELMQLEERRAIHAAEDAMTPRSERRARRRACVIAYLDERRRQGRGVPVWAVHISKSRRVPPGAVAAPPVNWQLLHQKAGLDANIQRSYRFKYTDIPDLVIAAVNEIGVEVGGMDTPISLDPDTGQPWRPRFDARALRLEERLLQAACYIVCAYLTGMRDCEVQAMRTGCLSITRSEDGVIERHSVRSVVYKGKAAQGEPAEWITIAPVATAISVLEQLVARSAARRGTETLWPVLDLGRARKKGVSIAILAHLNEFRDHLNARFGTGDAPIIPAGPSGATWRFTTRQFRRTIAWHIANRPFGTIAGMIQYKHASVAAFEGYAGSSRSGFRAEVEAERRLGQVEDILTYFDERQASARLSGPAAARVSQALDAAATELQPLSGMIADRGRLRILLADTARTLHVGVLADCFFDPATAVCLRRATASDRTAPMISLCEPARCPNACITRRHRPAWERTADDARALLKEKRLSGLQRTALTQELHRIETILAAVEDPDSPVTLPSGPQVSAL